MFGFAVFLLFAMAAAAPGQVVPGPAEPAPADPIEALALVRTAAERAPTEFAPALAVAQALTALGRTDDALAAFARARSLLEVQQDAPPGRQGDGADVLPGDGQPEGVGVGGEPLEAVAAAYLAPALLLRDLDRTGEAIELLEEAGARRLGNADVHEQLALLRLADGQTGEALAAVDAAWAESLTSPGLDLARGLALARDPERREEALEALQRALDAGAGDPVVVHLEAAELLAAEARYPEALEHLRSAEALAADDPEVHYRLGRTFAAVGDRERAEAALARYRSLQGARERVLEAERAASSELAAGLSEAQDLATSGELEASLRRLDGLVESRPQDDPRLGDVHSLRSKVLFSMRRSAQAAASAALARQLQPEETEHHYLEGLFLHAEGRTEDALRALERAVALDPDLGEAHALLGMIAAEAGRPAEAADRMERALELGLESNAPLRFHYARALEALGRSEEAQVQMEAFDRLSRQPPP